jgi:hypothetical protein
LEIGNPVSIGVVAHVANAVPVGILLLRIPSDRAVVSLVRNAVTVTVRVVIGSVACQIPRYIGHCTVYVMSFNSGSSRDGRRPS